MQARSQGGCLGCSSTPLIFNYIFLKMIFNKIEFVWHVLSKYGFAKIHNAAS